MSRSATQVTKADIEHIAQLARLRLSDTEVGPLSEQLSSVLSHFQEIEKVDTTGVEPLLTPSDIVLNLRDDIVEKMSTTEKLMQNAPEKAGNLFKVPQVVG